MSPFIDLHRYTREEIEKEKQEIILEFLEDLESDKFIWEIYDKWEEKLK